MSAHKGQFPHETPLHLFRELDGIINEALGLDRVSARTNAGGDSNEFDPASAADDTALATALVGSVAPSNWTNNQTITDGMAAIRVQLIFGK